nr:hypothetical protein JG3_0270 [uncultured bacterium]
MKSLVVYYSHYGNTASMAVEMLNILNRYGPSDIVQLSHSAGRRNPLKRVLYRFMPALVELNTVQTDLRQYDLLCLGIPVFVAHPSSAVLKYLSMCKGLDKVNIMCCYVYGFEANARKCSKYLHNVLKKYSQAKIEEVFVSWSHVGVQGILAPAMIKIADNFAKSCDISRSNPDSGPKI